MSELETQIANRRGKRAALEEAGVEIYPRRFDYDLETTDVHARGGGSRKLTAQRKNPQDWDSLQAAYRMTFP